MSLSIERKRPIVIEHSRQPSVGLSVCPVHCGPVDEAGFGDRETGRGNFGGKYREPTLLLGIPIVPRRGCCLVNS